MKKIHKILIGIFCGGVLLCGLGVGIAFTEFSHFTYGGEQILGAPDIQTEFFDVEFDPGNGRHDIVGWTHIMQDLTLDESIPENTVRFRVIYNAKRYTPHAYLDETNMDIALSCRWNNQENENAILMEAMDLVLTNLKDRKIISLDTMDVEEISVLINPANEDDVRIIY